MSTPQPPAAPEPEDPLARALEIHRRLQAEYAQDFLAVPLALSVSVPDPSPDEATDTEPVAEDAP